MSEELEAELAKAKQENRRRDVVQAVRERWVSKFREESPEWSDEAVPPTQAEWDNAIGDGA